MEKVVIDDYHQMTTMDEVNWIPLTKTLSNFSSNLRAPFCTFTFTSKFLKIYLHVQTTKN